MKHRLQRIEIDKLFGRFDYRIDIDAGEGGIRIVTAPNGYGKSTILKIIRSFAYGDYFYFIQERFDEIRFILSNDAIVEVSHQPEDREKAQVTIRSGTNTTKIKDPFGAGDAGDRSVFIDRTFPFLSRIGPRQWRHDHTGEILDRAELLARYGDQPVFRRRMKGDDWLEQIRQSLSVFSIADK